MDTLHISAGDTLTIEWAAGDTLELVDNAIFVMPENPNSGGSAVDSVNGQTGEVVLSAADVGADVAGSAQAVSEALQPQVTANAQAIATKASTTALNEVRGLAESNEQKLSTKAEQSDLEALGQVVSEKVDQATYNAFVQACALLASRDFVIEQINGILGGVSIDFDTLKEIADRLQLDSDQFGVITNALSKRIRFDAAQTLTSGEQQQARDNINAETKGTAAALVGAITPASIGAATAAQGTKANTALQSGDVAPVALSGSFWDLVNKTKIFDVGFAAYAVGANTALAVGDTLGVMLGKAQSQINALWAGLADKVNSALLGAPNGVATLGSDGILTAAQRPASSGGGTATDIFGVGMGFQVGKQINEMWYDTNLNTASVITYQMPAANWGITFPVFFRENLTISEIGFYVNTAVTGSNAQIGIYSAHPTHGYPYQKLYGSSNINTGSTGGKSQTVSGKFTFTKNKVYWIKLYTTHTITVTCSNGIYHPVIGASIFGNNINGPRGNGFSQVGAMAAITPYFSLDSSGDGNSEVPLSIANASFATLTAIPVIAFRAAAP